MSKIWDEYMNSHFAREVMAELDKEKRKKEAQAYSVNMDRNKLYDVGPGMEPAALGDSVETMGVSGGGGSMVGSGDSKALYTMKTTPVQGGAEAYADGVVEGKEAIHKRMLEVAMKEPHGNPRGSQDNKAEKWEGLAAAGKSVKPFTKSAQEMMDAANCSTMEMESEEGLDLDQLLDALEGHEEAAEDELQLEDAEEAMDADMMMDKMAAKKVAFLEELVQIADELDAEGRTAEASEIDKVIKAEVQSLRQKKS